MMRERSVERPLLRLSVCLAVSCVTGTIAVGAAELSSGEVAAPSQPSAAKCAPSRYAADTYFPAPVFPRQTRAPAAVQSRGYKVEVLAKGLAHPWALAFLPDARMLVTERPGRLRIVDRSGTISKPIAGMPAIEEWRPEDGGLHDLLLDPQFETNRVLYFTYYTLAPGERESRKPDKLLKGVGQVVRARLSSSMDRLEDLRVLYEGAHVRRLAYGPNGTLLVTTTVSDPHEQPQPLPQSLASDEGKVLRINPDGSIPRDNPWVGEKGARPELYAIGFKDPEGLTLDSSTGRLWALDHGPRGGDELNVIRPGANYGWATITYGRGDAGWSGKPIDKGLTSGKGLEQPVYFWTPSIAPSGLLVYSGKMFPQWKGNVFVGALAYKKLVRLEMRDGRVATEESMLAARCDRIRDVREGPEGAIYVLTDEDDGQILRLIPEGTQ